VLIRIVRMTFHPDALRTFLSHFDDAAPQIRAQDGCLRLALWQDTRFPNCCTTYSHWRDQAALQAYRDSTLFETTWAKVKPLFAAQPEAQSYTRLRPAEGDASVADDPDVEA
jgi:quinol monooxygenase YgiN